MSDGTNRKPGRPRKHASDKEANRLANIRYREKKAAEKELAAADVLDKANVLKVHLQWCGNGKNRKRWPLVTKPGTNVGYFEIKEKRAIFLHSDRAGKFRVVERTSANFKNVTSSAPIDDFETAIKTFEEVCNEIYSSDDYKRLRQYSSTALSMIQAYNKRQPASPPDKVHLGLVLQIRDLWVGGFPGHSPKKRKGTAEHINMRLRRAYASIGNVILPKTSVELSRFFDDAIEAFASYKDGISEQYLSACMGELISAFELAAKIGVYPQYHEISKDTIWKSVDEAKDDNDQIYGEESYPHIPIEYLKEILDLAYQTDREVYNYTILGLTTALRNSELNRLVEDPKLFVMDGVSLDYKGLRVAGDELLVQKTKRKVKSTKLQNPHLSLIGRILLKRRGVSLPGTFFEARKNRFRANPLLKHLHDYHQRCLRSTAATMLSFCDGASNKGQRATLDLVQARMAHKTKEQILQRYAPNPPSQLEPEAYFNLTEIPISKELYMKYMGVPATQGIDLAVGSNLWDLWLLGDFIVRSKSSESEAEFCDTMKMIITEWNEFAGNKAHDDFFRRPLKVG